MKKTLILLSALAFLALGTTSCKQSGTTGDAASADDAASGQGSPAAGEIVFIRLDSLMSNFAMYKELSATFEERSTKADADVTSRGRALEREVMAAQDRVQKGLVTQRQAEALQTELAQKQQNFVNFRDNLVNELAEEEGVMMRRINHCIELFIAEFNADNRYKMVLSTAGGSPIMIADPSLDVTAEAIEGLNAYYTVNKDSL
jgi:outer membrane protein